jgi:hypothetical protein
MKNSPKGRVLLHQLLESLGACHEAVEWSRKYGLDYETAWQKCQRSDWMLWLLAKTDCGDTTYRKIAIDCAAAVLHIFEKGRPGDYRPRKAIEAARAYLAGACTLDELRGAYAAAAAAYVAANAAAAADADADAAAAADADADAADAASYASYAAAAASYASYAAAAIAPMHVTCADIIRTHTAGMVLGLEKL